MKELLIALLTGYNSTYRMSKALNSETLAFDGTISSDYHDAGVSLPVDESIIAALASIGLFTLVEPELSALGVENRIADIASGKFAQRKAGSDKTPKVTVPTTIEQLNIDQVTAALGTKKHTIELSSAEVFKMRLLGLLSKDKQTSLDVVLQRIISDAEKIKVLSELFGITLASTTLDDEKQSVYACKVDATHWKRVFDKVKLSNVRGWSVPATSVSLDDTMLNFQFELVFDKVVNAAYIQAEQTEA